MLMMETVAIWCHDAVFLAMMLFDQDLPVETVLDIVYDKHYMLMENCGVSMISLR